MKVINEIQIYAVDGNVVAHSSPSPSMAIQSCRVPRPWNEGKLVIVHVEGHSYAVSAEQLKVAIDNAINWK
jgi:hypothetical protein